MSFLVSDVITTVQTELLESGSGVYWTQPELIDYCDKGIKTLAGLKPDTVANNATYTFINGTATQVIPSDGFLFLDLIKNLSPSVSAIRQVERNHLDHADPNWPAASGTSVLHFTFDPRNPRYFQIYPQSTGTQTAEILYAQTQPTVTALTDSVDIDNVYVPCLVYYTLSMAYSKNTKRQDITKSSSYMALFGNFIGQKMPMQIQFSPKTPTENSSQ